MAAGMQADGPPGAPAGPCGGAGGRVQHRAHPARRQHFGKSAEVAATCGDEVKW